MERDLLSCSICSDLIMDPKTLTCMHRFCKSCLSGHIVASTARTSSTRPGFACPVCKEFIPAPDSSRTPSVWAGLFKTDFMVKGMVEVYQSKHDASARKVSNLCPKHGDKERELFCFDCSAPACHLCAVISHRGCAKIGTVKEAAQELRSTWQKHFMQIPLSINKDLELEKLQESYMKEIYKNKASVEKNIKEEAEATRKAITTNEVRLLKQVQGNYTNLQRKALIFTDKIKRLKSSEMEISSKLSSSSDFDLAVDKDVSNTIESVSQEKQVIYEDCSRFCDALSSVKWTFQRRTNYCISLGTTEFKFDAGDVNPCIFPMPQSPKSYLSTVERVSSKTDSLEGEHLENACSETPFYDRLLDQNSFKTLRKDQTDLQSQGNWYPRNFVSGTMTYARAAMNSVLRSRNVSDY